jgi:hypothetical protein
MGNIAIEVRRELITVTLPQIFWVLWGPPSSPKRICDAL